MTVTTREIHLAARPTGVPARSDFRLAETVLPAPAEGEVLVRNTWMSVDPYMRGRMDDAPSYIPPFALDAPLEGSAVGEVIASRAEGVPVGTLVSHFAGWREHALLPATAVFPIDATGIPAEHFLGVLGTTGLTAWAALTDAAPVKEGDTVFVSAAAGAVGSVAGQLARRYGAARVIGSAGGPDKGARAVRDFGYDIALDYRAGDLAGQLERAAPEGIDVYVDHVGGDHLEAAIGALRPGGRIALVGAISSYNDTEPAPGPANLFRLAALGASVKGVLVNHYLDRFGEWIGEAAPLLAEGSLRGTSTVLNGLEKAPEAFLGVLSGANVGKMLVRL
ncbi:NADP-dependent oxidoreductase [Actinorhabdospora filicis]|uniref:NADP-dependent oxidoreductase n=1 Tax=Actinorhabdospora filicis TaxID=1785913 RepID=A0A9W6SNY2_9ACTN|nr:NADP-dependent oxidoreductase [Actinorhabdospora filicis]GLZ79698.1 NADP-dependent oxidoreductase [Actinorhabdospora filicis]